MKRKNIIYPVIVVLVLLMIIFTYQRYTHQNIIKANTHTVCFERNILPVFKNNCGVVDCHDQQTMSGGYALIDYNSIMKGVVPFKPAKSMVYKTITGKETSSMPPGLELTVEEKQLINNWISQGAGNTMCSLNETNEQGSAQKAISERGSSLEN